MEAVMLNCCDGNCNQGRDCPARVEQELWPTINEWVDRLIGFGIAILMVAFFLALAYLSLTVAR
jgi:hypothetical protein